MTAASGIDADALVIGGGPAGLMAAEQLLAVGLRVHLFDAMPSLGRKFLLAGRGGLNLTHSEPLEMFRTRYRTAEPLVTPWLAEFPPDALRDWAAGLGIATFIGTSGRVFPMEFKAAPLLRAWLARLRAQGLVIHVRHRWTGGLLPEPVRFATPAGEVTAVGRVMVLALGGASWPTLGSDGAWAEPLAAAGVAVAPLVPANCGFLARWSDPLRRFAGTPFKNIALSVGTERVRGELILSEDGLEGGAVYALSAPIRDAIAAEGQARVQLDLKPDLSPPAMAGKLAESRGAASWSTYLKRVLRLSPAAIALLHEAGPLPGDTPGLIDRIKAVPLILTAPRPIAEVISSAGGIAAAALTPGLALRNRPGVFVAGEMLDWEAPTGGYLLQACFASGRWAGRAAAQFCRDGTPV